MTEVDLPFGARTSDVFATPVWVADFRDLEPYREQLVSDVVAQAVDAGPAGGFTTEPDLQDRTEPWWVECHRMVDAFTLALAGSLIPGFRGHSIHSWGTVRNSAADYGDPVDPLTTYQGATYACVLPLQIPSETEGSVAMTLRDPMYHLRNRFGFHTDCAIVPSELRMFVFPAYLERFTRPPASDDAFGRSAVNVMFDVWYY